MRRCASIFSVDVVNLKECIALAALSKSRDAEVNLSIPPSASICTPHEVLPLRGIRDALIVAYTRTRARPGASKSGKSIDDEGTAQGDAPGLTIWKLALPWRQRAQAGSATGPRVMPGLDEPRVTGRSRVQTVATSALRAASRVRIILLHLFGNHTCERRPLSGGNASGRVWTSIRLVARRAPWAFCSSRLELAQFMTWYRAISLLLHSPDCPRITTWLSRYPAEPSAGIALLSHW